MVQLKVVLRMRFPKVLYCSNSLLYINLIKEEVITHYRFANEIPCIQNDWEVTFSHTFREGNACADVFAKLGAS
jgi:hypothetical protein